MGFKLQPVSGVKVVAAAGTAERLISTSGPATKVVAVRFTAPGDMGIIIGDSGVDWTAGATQEGMVISDGTLASTVFASVDLNVLEGMGAGMKFVNGMPYIDLFDIYVDAETTSDRIFWMGWRVGTN